MYKIILTNSLIYNKIRKIYDDKGNHIDFIMDISVMVETKNIDYLVSFGGHKNAAGITINKDDFEIGL